MSTFIYLLPEGGYIFIYISAFLSSGALYPDFGLLWSPISPLGHQGDFLVPRASTATRQKRAFSIVGSSVWNDLPLNFVLCRGTFSVLFINSSRLSSLAEPGLGAPLSSYLEGALYKLKYKYIDR